MQDIHFGYILTLKYLHYSVSGYIILHIVFTVFCCNRPPYMSGAQTFLTARPTDTSALAKCHKGGFKIEYYVQCINILCC